MIKEGKKPPRLILGSDIRSLKSRDPYSRTVDRLLENEFLEGNLPE